jgi:hypothetical protein
MVDQAAHVSDSPERPPTTPTKIGQHEEAECRTTTIILKEEAKEVDLQRKRSLKLDQKIPANKAAIELSFSGGGIHSATVQENGDDGTMRLVHKLAPGGGRNREDHQCPTAKALHSARFESLSTAEEQLATMNT